MNVRNNIRTKIITHKRKNVHTNARKYVRMYISACVHEELCFSCSYVFVYVYTYVHVYIVSCVPMFVSMQSLIRWRLVYGPDRNMGTRFLVFLCN